MVVLHDSGTITIEPVAATRDAYDRFREICLSLPETSEVFVEEWGIQRLAGIGAY